MFLAEGHLFRTNSRQTRIIFSTPEKVESQFPEKRELKHLYTVVKRSTRKFDRDFDVLLTVPESLLQGGGGKILRWVVSFQTGEKEDPNYIVFRR